MNIDAKKLGRLDLRLKMELAAGHVTSGDEEISLALFSDVLGGGLLCRIDNDWYEITLDSIADVFIEAHQQQKTSDSVEDAEK